MKKNDYILIISLLFIAAVLLILVKTVSESGAYVIVRIDGQQTGKYSISDNGVYELNNGTNIMHIEDGNVWVTDADCPDKLCVNQGKISKSGQVITCLPNKLTITVYGTEKGIELIG